MAEPHPLRNDPRVTRRTAAPTGPPGLGLDGGGPHPPSDPLKNGRTAAGQITREIPLSTVSTSWTVADVRYALEALSIGLFDRPAQLVDALFTASRVQAAMGSRTGGLLGRSLDWIVPKAHRDSAAANECADAIGGSWDEIDGEDQLDALDSWGIMLGFGPSQLLWDFDRDYATPTLSFWSPRFTYWHWTDRHLIAIGQDSQERITPGDGHWVLHAPKGAYRGWMRSAMRAVAEPWLSRAYGRRDWNRFSERHGFPIIKAKTPSDADPPDADRFRTSLASLGQESVVELPQGADETQSYDVEYLQADGKGSESFASLIASCDAEITLAIMSQNLTTEVKEGSYAAARVHADVRQSLLEADARALAKTVYRQIARPFAAINFGDPNLAPMPRWDVKPYEDDLTAAQTFLAFASALERMSAAGWELDNPAAAARRFGIDLGAAKLNPKEPAAPMVTGVP